MILAPVFIPADTRDSFAGCAGTFTLFYAFSRSFVPLICPALLGSSI